MINMDGKSSFLDITKNPEVSEFLKDCSFMHEPNGNEIEKIKNQFIHIEKQQNVDYPKNIIAIASDFYEAKVRDDIPFTNVGYIKVVNFLLKKNLFASLSKKKFLDPFEVAKFQKDKEAYVFVLPSSNMLYKNEKSVMDSFRLKLYETFKEYKSDKSSTSNLLETLFYLNSFKNGGNKNEIKLNKCPSCGEENIVILKTEAEQFCSNCHSPVYPTDVLRIWEEVKEDSASNISPLTRLNNAIKHILLAHTLRMIKEINPNNYRTLLSDIVFVINGPLAIYGTPAWIHSCLQKIIYDFNKDLTENHFSKLMIVGMIEESSVLSYANFLNKHINNSSILCVSDYFRKSYIDYNKTESSTTFGNETFYGQDFIYKNDKGRIKVFQIPYPFRDKSNLETFKVEKSNINNYGDLNKYIKFLDDFDCDMFTNSIIPSVLSKQFSMISLQPGASMINLISKTLISDK